VDCNQLVPPMSDEGGSAMAGLDPMMVELIRV